MDRVTTLNLSEEELASALTHGLGVIMCFIGIPILMSLGARNGDWHHLLGLGIFCFSLMMVYLSSTLYHSISSPKLKALFHRIDHISIFFLIAGTHTPFLLYFLNNDTGMFYLALLWGLVMIGVLYKLFFFGKMEILSLLFYIAMGWMAVFTIPEMLHVMPEGCVQWIVAGGISYTLGVIFFVWEKLPYHHAIWHLFVMGGSTGHFIAMLYLVQ